MRIIKLDIYSLQTGIIQKGTPKNWLKGGKLSKRALKEKGSFTVTLLDNEDFIWKYSELEKYGYTNIHTGYIDNVLHMQKDNEKYIAYLTLYTDKFINGLTLGFSKHE